MLKNSNNQNQQRRGNIKADRREKIYRQLTEKRETELEEQKAATKQVTEDLRRAEAAKEKVEVRLMAWGCWWNTVRRTAPKHFLRKLAQYARGSRDRGTGGGQ